MMRGDWMALGSVMPLSDTGKKDRIEEVFTLRFTHPGLPQQTFVRRVGAAMKKATQDEMERMGFVLSEKSPAWGLQTQKALGFRGWGLAHHPEKSTTILKLYRSMKKAGARAKSKPREAEAAFLELAGEVLACEEGLLPSYWEHAGRVFLKVHEPALAALCFERAREAERQYQLEVDEAARLAAYYEFADAWPYLGPKPLEEPAFHIPDGLLAPAVSIFPEFLGTIEPKDKTEWSATFPKTVTALLDHDLSAQPETASALQWELILPYLGRALAFVATRSLADEAVLAARRQALQMLCETSAKRIFGARFWVAELGAAADHPLFAPVADGPGSFFSQLPDGRVAFLRRVKRPSGVDGRVPFQVVVADDGREFERPPGTYGTIRRVEVPDDLAFLEGVLAELDKRGPVPVDEATRKQVLAEVPKELYPKHVLLWTGVLPTKRWHKSFASKETRKALSLKTAEVETAYWQLTRHAEWSIFDGDTLARSWAEFARLKVPSELWEGGSFSRWRDWVHKKVTDFIPVPAELWQFPGDVGPLSTALMALTQGDLSYLSRENFTHSFAVWEADCLSFQVRRIDAFVALFFILANRLPVGHPLLGRLLEWMEVFQSLLLEDNLVIGTGALRWDTADEAQSYFDEREGEARASIYYGIASGWKGHGDQALWKDDGDILWVYRPQEDAKRVLRFHRTKLLAEKGGLGVFTSSGLLTAFWGEGGQAVLRGCREPALTLGESQADPRKSAPEVLKEMESQLSLSPDKAAVYLLTLAHPYPEPKEVQSILGMKAKAYREACQALTDRGLLVGDKHPFVDRKYFLPGTWESMGPGMEAWKKPGLVLNGESYVVPEPFSEAFKRTWARLQKGDPPS